MIMTDALAQALNKVALAPLFRAGMSESEAIRALCLTVVSLGACLSTDEWDTLMSEHAEVSH
jgi:hypothetical protein